MFIITTNTNKFITESIVINNNKLHLLDMTKSQAFDINLDKIKSIKSKNVEVNTLIKISIDYTIFYCKKLHKGQCSNANTFYFIRLLRDLFEDKPGLYTINFRDSVYYDDYHYPHKSEKVIKYNHLEMSYYNLKK